MSFCPKCKLEYEDGITICKDCNCALVDSLEYDVPSMAIYYDEDEAYCQNMIAYLQHQGISQVALEFSDEKQAFAIMIAPDVEQTVRKLLNTYLEQELQEETRQMRANSGDPSAAFIGEGVLDSDDDRPLPKLEFQKRSKSSGMYYEKKADKQRDLKDSGVSLMIIGVLGDAYLIGKALGVIPFGPATTGVTSLLFNLVMGTLFTVFLVGGFLSLRSAKALQKEIPLEEQTTKELLDTFSVLDQNELDTHYATNVDEGTLYFNRTDYLRALITKDYPDLEETFLEEMIEQLYTNIFEA